MMTWIIIIALLVFFVTVMVIKAKRGIPHSLVTLENPIKDLLKRGYNGGFLLIRIGKSKLFIQFKKYIKKQGYYGIEFCFPNSSWSHEYFRKIERLCGAENIKYTISEGQLGQVMQFLIVDFGKESQKAYDFAKKIFFDVFVVDGNATFYVKLENAAVDDILIDEP